MNRFISLLAAVLMATPGITAQEAETIEFDFKSLPVGTVIVGGDDMSMKVKLTMAANGTPMMAFTIENESSNQTRFTILESDERGTSKVEVAVLKSRELTISETEGTEETVDSPLVGRRFIATRTADGISVKEKGSDEELAEPERTEVIDKLSESDGDLIRPDFDFLAARRKLTMGESVELTAKEREEFFDDDQMVCEKMVVKPTGKRRSLGSECLVLEVSFTSRVKADDDGTPPMTMTFAGEFIMMMDYGWSQSADLSGPITFEEMKYEDESFEDSDVTMTMSGKGKVSMKAMSLFTLPKKD